jgi:hypothetical protein
MILSATLLILSNIANAQIASGGSYSLTQTAVQVSAETIRLKAQSGNQPRELISKPRLTSNHDFGRLNRSRAWK